MLASALPTSLTFPGVGLLAGIAIGLTGMGGGVLLTPIMVLLLGVPARTAIGNDLLVSLLVKPVGAVKHDRAGTVRRDIVVRLAAGSVPAAFLGAVLANHLFTKDGALLEAVLGATLLTSAAMMIYRMLVSRRATGDSSEVPVEQPARTIPTIAVGAIGGLLVGITSVGSGSLMLVLLMWLYPRLSSRQLVGTDLVQAVPLVASAALGHVLFGDIRFSIVLPVLAGALPGVWLGSKWSSTMPDRALRPLLTVLVSASGLRLIGVI